MRFYASQRIGLYALAQITEGTGAKKQRVGNNISFRIKKNKVAAPKPPYKTEVIYDESYGELGFSRYKGLSEILFDLEVLTKSGNTVMFDGDNIAGSKAELEEVLAGDQELRSELLEDANINTIEMTQELLDSITENRYPVPELKAAANDEE